MMPAPFEILRKTPRTNCGKCGYATCLAFSASVSKAGEEPSKCPFLEASALSLEEKPAKEDLSALEGKRDLKLIAQLKEKVASLDLAAIAPRLGIEFDPARPESLRFFYLGQKIIFSREKILMDEKIPEDPRDQILLYNYIHSGGGEAPALDWIGLESLPNSISKVKTLSTYCEERLASLFSGIPPESILAGCGKVHAVRQPEAPASLGFQVPVLPRVPQYLLFWDADPEEGFPARVKVLFDRRVLDFLDLESLVFSAERLADRLAALIQ